MSLNKIKVTRIRNVKLPTRATTGSVGCDIYMPADLTKVDMKKTFDVTRCQPRIDFDFNTGYLKNLMIAPGDDVLIPTGLKINVPEGYVLKIENKSGVSAVKDLVVGGGIVDCDYQGEIMVNLHNVSNKKIAVFNPNDKIAQFVIYPCEFPEVEEVETEKELFRDKNSERGEGGFGSTGS